MTEQHAPREWPRHLSEFLAEGPAWSPAAQWNFFRSLAEQVLAHHRAGRIHRGISPETITIDSEHRPRLEPPLASRRFCRADYDPQTCPPELAEVESLDLPMQIEAARQVLADQGCVLDPRRVDVYQLGAILCQLLVGEPFIAYLYDPLVKGRIPPAARPVVERALGEGDGPPLESCEELLALVGRAGAGASTEPPALPKQETPARASMATSDTSPGEGAAAGPADADGPLPFERLGPFRIVRRIGRGGMGDVYQGFDESLGRIVAIKVLPPELARDQEFIQRFRAEATAAGQLSHPNVVSIYTIGEDAGHHFFAMQFVEGQSLADRLARCRRLPPEEALEILKQCLSGLQAAHQRGLIHRDIKPGNVLLDHRTGLAMLVDFGLVRVAGSSRRITATGAIMGTVDYIAPEQALGQPVDGRSDLYSLGVLAYEMLSGQLPFEADSATAMVFQHAYGKPRPLWQAAPEAPRALVDIVTRMMARQPLDRYGSAEDVLADIRAYEAGEPLATATSAGPATARFEAADLAALPELPPQTTRWLQPNWRQALLDRAMSLFRARAPRFLQELQTTGQQVDGAIAAYQRRHDKLARLVKEAEEIAGELAARKESYLRTIGRAEQRSRQASRAASAAAARRELEHCRQAAAEVGEQERQSREGLDELRVAKAKVQARLAQLVYQRDLLEARLKMARARAPRPDRGARRRRMVWVAAISTALVLAVGVRYWAKGMLHPPAALNEQTETPRPQAPPSSISRD